MESLSGDLARRLAARADDVCRHYLPNGKRVGAYWIAGDMRGAEGRSLYVRLTGPLSGKGAAGKWTDAATGEHGDLLDLIAASCRLASHRDVLDEARRFLNLSEIPRQSADRSKSFDGAADAQRLFAESRPLAGTVAETYLRSRGFPGADGFSELRFHPRCLYRESAGASVQYWPALIAAVTDDAGTITGVMRTYLARDGREKVPLACPRKALGALAGNAVRFGDARDALIIGEGIETVLSLRRVLPGMPIAAALSAQHLRAFEIPPPVKRLYIAVDRDDAGLNAAEASRQRARDDGVDVRLLLPMRKDFNDDLMIDGPETMAGMIWRQLAPVDRRTISPRR